MDELMVLRQESPPRGSIIVWDAHFCPNEAKLPLENLLRNPDLVLLKAFIPETSLKTLEGYNFEIYVFMKANEKHVNIYRL